jgi:hypothetical protein
MTTLCIIGFILLGIIVVIGLLLIGAYMAIKYIGNGIAHLDDYSYWHK